MSKTLRGRRWTGWSKRQPSLVRPFPVLRVEELEARATPAQFTWTGAGANQNWSTAANWVSSDPTNFPKPTGDPANFESLTFPNGPTVRAANNDITFNGVSGTFFTITVSGGNYALSGKAVTLGTAAASGNISVGANITGSHIDLDMTLAGAALSKQFFTVSDNSTFTINGKISGNSGSIFTKDGIGTLVLTANNSSFTGNIQIIDGGGTLQITNPNALGNLSGTTTVGTNGILAISNVAGNINESLVINGPGLDNLGALRSVAGAANVWSGPILVDTNSTFGAESGTSLNITGPISDSGVGRDIVKEGPGEVRFSAANSYRGSTTIEDGTLTISNSLALGTADRTAATGTRVNDPSGSKAGSLQIVGTGFTVLNERLELHNAGRSGTGSLLNSSGDNNWAGPLLLDNVNVSEGSTVTIGAALNTNLIVSGVVTGTRPLIKVNTGRLIFDNNNTYGPLPLIPAIPGTIVAQGFMTMRDSGAMGANAVQVADGATLEMDVEIATPTINRMGYNQTTGAQFGRDLWNDSFYGAEPNKLRLANQITINGRGFEETGALRSKSGINAAVGKFTLDAAGSDASIGVDLDQRPGHPTPTSDYWTNDYSLTVNTTITGGAGTNFLKRGFGHLILPNANTYSGVSQIEEGWVTILNDQALGPALFTDANFNGIKDPTDPEIHDTTTPRIYVLTGAAIHIRTPAVGTPLSLNRNLTITGTGPSLPYSLLNSKGALVNIGGDNLWTGDIQVLGSAGIGVEQIDPSLPVSELRITGSMKDAINSQTFTSDSSIVEGAIWIDTGTTSGTVTATLTIAQPPSQPISNFRIYYPPRYRAGSTQLFNYPGGYGSPPPRVTANQAYSGTSSILEYVVNEPTGNGSWSLTVTSPTVAGSLLKYGSQRLRLQGDATYSGSTQVLEGILRNENDTGVGRASSGTLTTQETFSQTQTSVSPGAVLELQHGLASANGGIASGLVVYDERLVLNGSGYQVHVAGDPLDAQFRLAIITPTFHSVDTGFLPITATALQLQTAINADPEMANQGLTATVTRNGSIFTIFFGDTLSSDVLNVVSGVLGSAEVRIVNGQASVNNLSDDNTWRGPVSLTAGSRISTADDSRFVILGAIDDSSAGATGANLVKRGNGELTLGGANTYRGTTLASAGVLTLLNSQALGFGDSTAATGTIIAPGAQLQLAGSLTINNEALTISGTGTSAANTPDAIPVRWVQAGPGPSNQGQTPGNTPVTGRVTGVAVDPADSNVIYIATAGGGAWKTKDGGKTWLPLFDFAANTIPMNGGSLLIDPTNRRTIFFATGEGNNTVDSFAGTGVWRSTDAGVTWSRLENAAGSLLNPLAGLGINKIVVDAATGNLYAATSDLQSNGFNVSAPGIWRYDGTTWTNLTAITSVTRATMKGKGTFTTPVNTPGPDDDYRVTFPQTRVSWNDLAIINYVPSPGFSAPFTPKASRAVIFATAMEESDFWFPDPIAPTQDTVFNGGYMSGVFRCENPTAGTPNWLIGDSGEAYNTSNNTWTAPTADNRSNNQFPSGPFEPNTDRPWRNTTNSGASQPPRNGRIAIAVAGGGQWTGVTVWSGIARPTDVFNQTANDGRLLEIRTSTTGGLSWVQSPVPIVMNDVFGASGLGQGPYSIVMMAANTTTFYVGGTSANNIWVGSGSGAPAFTNISVDAANNGPFAMNHAMAIDSSGSLLLGGDGGIYRYDPVTGRWNDLNGTLSASLITSVAPNLSDFNSMAAGSASAGTTIFTGGTNWTRTDGEFGGIIQRDPNNPNILYHVQYYPEQPNTVSPKAVVRKSTDGGQTWITVFTPVPTTRDAYPIALDPINPSRIITADGTSSLYETLNGFISSPGGIGAIGGTVRHIALGGYQGNWVDDPGFPLDPNGDTDRGANAYDPRTMYAANDNTPYVTKDGGLNWVQRSLGVRDDVYTFSFDTGVLRYKNWPQITFSGVPAGAYVTARTILDGNGSAAPNFGVQRQEQQTIEVIYPSATTGTFNATFTFPADATYGTPAKTFTIPITLGVSTAATIQTAINSALATPTAMTGDEYQALVVSNVSTTSAPTFKLTVPGFPQTADIAWAGHIATTVANIQAQFAATTPPTTGVTPVLIGGQIYLRFTGTPNTNVATMVTATASNMEMYVREAQQGGAGTASVSGGNNNGTSLQITGLTVDPSNHDHVIATVLYTNHANGPTVFQTTDAGRSWADITGAGLPTLALNGSTATVTQSVWSSTFDARSGRIYVGTDIGVYASDNNGAAWTRFGDGLPNVAVRDLELNVSQNILSVGTYGRGVYQLFLSSAKTDSGAIRAVSGNSTWSGPVTLAGNTRMEVDGTQVIQNGIAAASLNILGTISDPAGDFDIVKEGQGTLIFSGANTYGGVTYVEHGVLQVNNPNALGDSDAASNTIVRSGSALELATDLYREPVELNGDGYLFSGHFTGAMRNVSGVNTYTGPLTMATPTTIGVNSNTQLTIGAKDGDSTYVNGNGSITDGTNNFTLTKELTGTLVLANANSYDGQTNIIQGALRVAHADSLGVGPGTGDTLVYNGAQLQISRNNATLLPTIVTNESLRLSGTGINVTGAIQNVRGDSIPGGTNDNEWAGSLQLVRQDNFSPTSVAVREVAFGSSDVRDTLRINTSISQQDASYVVDKVGLGRITFVMANTYTGQTNVNAGTLRIMDNGSLGLGAPGTIVNSGATLELDGTTAALGPNETLTLIGEGVNNVGALYNVANNNAYNGAITLGANNQTTILGGSIGAVLGTTLTVNGALQDPVQNGTPGSINPLPGRFRKAGAGTVVLPDAKTYAGATLVSDGILNIQSAQSLGTPRNEVQFIQVIATTGTFALSFKGVSTAPIAFNAPASAVKAALEAITPLSSIGATVTVTLLNAPGIDTYTITFDGGPLQNTDQPAIIPIYVQPSTFTRTPGTATVSEVQSFRVTSADPSSNWALTYGAARTYAIALNETAPVVEAAIEVVTGEDVVVARTGSSNDYTYTVTFTAFGPKTAFASLVQQGTTVVAGTNRDGQRGTTVVSGATLQVQGGLTFPATGELITLNGQGFGGIGALQVVAGNTAVFNLPILLGSDASIGVQGATDTLIINSVISDVGGGHDLDIYGLGTVQFNGNGKGSYSGTNYNNYYTGTTTVNSGTLLLNVTTQPPILGPLVVGNGINSGADGAATVRELLPDQVADTATVRVNSDGTFDLNGLVDTVGDLTMVGGDVLTGDNGQLTTGKITMSNGAEIFVGNNAKLTGNATTMTNSNIHVGTNSSVTVNGNLGMDASGIDYLSPGPGFLNVTGNVTMVNGSTIKFNAAPGTLAITALDILLNNSTIDLNDASSIAARNVTLLNTAHIDFDNTGVFTASGAVSVSSASDITFDNDGRFDIAGNLTLNNGKVALGPATGINTIPPLSPATTKATLTTARIDMTGGTSEINIGDNGYLTSNGPVSNAAGDILFGTNGTFRAVGTVGLSAAALVQFGAGGFFDNQSFNLILDNSKFLMGDNGTAKTFDATLTNGSKIQFANGGTLDADGNLTMSGNSELTFVDNGHATTNNIIITGGRIEFRDGGKLESANVTNSGAAISFDDTGEFDAATVTVTVGGTIGFGAAPSPTYTIAGGLNGKFIATGAVSLDASHFWMGSGGQASMAGLTLTNTTAAPTLLPNSTVTFDSNGTLTDSGPLVMTANSEIRFGTTGKLVSGDLSQTGGLIDFLDGGELDPANVLLSGGKIAFDNNGTLTPDNVTASNSFIEFGTAGTFAAAGNVSFAKTSLTMGTGANVDMLALGTTGATVITLGDNSTIDTTTVSVVGPSAVLSFGQNNTFTASGNVSIANATGSFGKNGQLLVTGDLTLVATPLDFGQTGLVRVTGTGNANLSVGSKITFADEGTFHTDGDITMVGTSRLVYASKGTLQTDDLSITTGSITMGTEAKAIGTGTANILSATMTLGANSTFGFVGDVTVAPSVPPAGTPALTIGDTSAIGTGKLTVTSGNLTIGATSTATTGDILTAGSKVVVGAGTTINAANVSSTGTTWTLNNNDTLSTSGNVKFENHGTLSKFGTGVTVDAEGDFTLNNASVTFGINGKVVAEDVFITKAKLTFGNVGTLIAEGPLHDNAGTVNLNNSGQIAFGNTGTFTGGDVTLVNSSVSGGTNIAIDIGSLNMDPSTFTLGSGSNGSIDGNVDITDGAISMGTGVAIVVTGNFTNNNAAVTFGASGSLAVTGDVSVDHGSTIFGGFFDFSAADVFLTSTTLNQGDFGSFTARDVALQDASLNLGTDIVGSVRNLGVFSSTVILGLNTVLAISGDLASDSSIAAVSTILGDGAIDLGSTSHALAVGNGDAADTVDLAISTEINSTPAARLTKTGAGRVELAAPSGSVVDLTISAGDVQVTSSAGDVELAGGTLSGTGTVAGIDGTSAAASVVAPGNNWDPLAKAGILNTGPAVWSPNTTFNVDLSSSVTGSPVYGVDYDVLQVAGDINLGDAVLTANYGPGITLNDTFTIVNATGTVSGKFQQFNGQDILFVSGQKFNIDYSSSNSVVLRKVRANATVSITSVTPNPSTFNQAVTIVATVVPELGSSLFPNTMTVTLYDNGTPIASPLVDLVGTQFLASFTTTSLTVGLHTLSATFNGDADNFNPSNSPLPNVTQTVQQPFTDALVGSPNFLSPNNPTSVGVQDVYSISTTARDERGTINWSIDFRNPSNTIVRTLTGSGSPGAGSTIPISTTWDGKNGAGNFVNINDGTYTATLTVTDSFGNTYSPPAISLIMDNTTPTASLPAPSVPTIDPSANPSVLPKTTTFSGTVSDTNLSGWVLSIFPNGSTTPIRSFSGSGTSVNETWDGTTSTNTQAPDGAYTITLTATDLAGNTTTTAAQTVVVLANGPVVSLNTGANSVYGSTYTLTATVGLPAGSPPSEVAKLDGDTVQFYRGALLLGTGTLEFNAGANAYQATYPVPLPSLGVGTYSNFSAVYVASTDFPQGVSPLASHTITAAPLSIVIHNKTRTYGAANPVFTFTVNTPVNGDSATAAVIGSPSTTANVLSGIGSYTIAAGTLAATSNYFINSIITGTLNITPAPIRIQIDDKSRPVNTPNPTFTYTVLDLLNGDPQSSVSALPMGTVAVISSPVGSYPITATGAPTNSPNYIVTSILPGTLAVTPVLTNFAVGNGASIVPTDPSRVNIYSPNGTLIRSFTPFGSFSGGIRTSVADFDGDGVQDVAVSTGPGAVAQVSVFSGVTGLTIFNTLPFEQFTGGLFVASGDINADGIAELVITPDEGGGPRVLAFKGGDFSPFISYFGIDDPNFRGGARAGVGDMNGDGYAEVAVSAGFQGGPRIAVWDGKALTASQFTRVMPDFFAYSQTLRNGAYVAIGDVNGDGKGDLITGAGPGGAPHVKIFSGASLLNPGIGPNNTVPFASFFAGNSGNRGGVRVAPKVFDNDLFVDLLTGAGDAGGDGFTSYLGKDLKDGVYLAQLDLDFPGLNNNGVFVG